MANTVYTIGYSGFRVEEFVLTLKTNDISLVVDVRSVPYSQFHFEYNKEYISKRLESTGIYYRNYAKEFGARQENRSYYPKGYLDFEIFAKSDEFLSGVEKLKKSMKRGYKFALMCSEKDPVICHRTILVARAFELEGYEIIHLMPDGKTMTQKDVEHCLLERYFPNRNQICMFSEMMTTNEYIEQAYKKQNENIGYMIEEEHR